MLIVLGAVLSAAGVSFALISQRLIDAATGANDASVTYMAVIMGAVIILQVGLQALNSAASARTTEDIRNTMRSGLLKKLIKADWLQLSAYHSGDVVTRLTSDVSGVVGSLTGILPSLVALVMQLILAFSLLLYFDTVLALFALALGPLFILISRIFAPRLKKYHIRTQELESGSRSFMQEVVQNISIVKAFAIEDSSAGRLEGLQKEHREWIVKRNWLSIFTNASIASGFWAGYFLAFIWGSYRLSQGLMTFGVVVAFIQLVGQIQRPFIGLARTVPRVVSSLASAGRLMEIDMMAAEADGGVKSALDGSDAEALVARDITCGYSGDKKVLKNISFKASCGEIVAVTGTSGEGKTTLLRLLLALMTPDSGELKIVTAGGRELDICKNTRKLISFVPQTNITFTGTIAQNLRIGKEDASGEELAEALRDACAWTFVKDLPGGMDTRIGEKGYGLSEGQLQRLAIARALLRHAPILLLDEATSALDPHTESMILQNIKNSSSRRLCLFVSHRPVVKDYCDRVIRIDSGSMADIT